MLESIKQKLTARAEKKAASKAAKAAKPAKPGKSKKKKWIATVSVLLVLAVCAAWALPKAMGGGGRQASLVLSDTTVLQYTDLRSSISASGTVESASSTTVYSTLSYTVKSVAVELGDYVEAGQLLAELDDQSIQDQITSQEISMKTSANSSAEQIKTAKANYDNYKYGLDNGLNSSLNSAQNQVETSYASYEKAVLTYERYRDSLGLGENTTVISAENSLRNAENTLETAESSLNSAGAAYNDAMAAFSAAEYELGWANTGLYDLKERRADLEAELAQLRQQQESGSAQLAEQQTAKSEKEAAIRGLQSQLDALRAEPAPPAESQPTDEGGASAPAADNSAALEQQIAQAQTELAAIEASIAQLESSSGAELEQEIARLEGEIAALDTQITQAEAAVTSQEAAYEQAEASVENAETQLDSAERSYDNAVESYESQLSSYNASMTTVDQTLADYLTSVDTAWESYQDALVSLEVAEKSAQDQLNSYANSLSSARTNSANASGEENLRQLRVDLESTKITAPVAGTVTAIYAEVGSGGSGLLFVIEDVDDLVVDTSINGYDMGIVQPGVAVSISSDATGEAEIDGILSSVAPTANKTSQGVTDTSSDSLFAAEVNVTTQGTGLKIGMEAQLDFIIEEESHVLAVPYDAVYQNAQGQSCVIAAEEQQDGTYLLKELPVTTGMSDDLDIAVSGTEIKEGMRVLNEPDSYRMYLGQSLPSGFEVPSGAVSMMPMGGGMMGGGR